MFFYLLKIIFLYLFSLFEKRKQVTPVKMRNIIKRIRCFDAGGCYEGEYNRWPRDSIVWFQPLTEVTGKKIKASIVKQERNFLICNIHDETTFSDTRVKVHKREIMDILSAPHFHYGLIGHREGFEMPKYTQYKSSLFTFAPLTPPYS
jgi:hypothetical protein